MIKICCAGSDSSPVVSHYLSHSLIPPRVTREDDWGRFRFWLMSWIVLSTCTFRCGVFLCIINLCIFVFILLFRRLHNLDVEVAASGFTRDMSESFDEVKTCEDTCIANREGRQEMTHPSQVSHCHTFF